MLGVWLSNDKKLPNKKRDKVLSKSENRKQNNTISHVSGLPKEQQIGPNRTVSQEQPTQVQLYYAQNVPQDEQPLHGCVAGLHGVAHVGVAVGVGDGLGGHVGLVGQTPSVSQSSSWP